jgi:hypothetical protein
VANVLPLVPGLMKDGLKRARCRSALQAPALEVLARRYTGRWTTSSSP